MNVLESGRYVTAVMPNVVVLTLPSLELLFHNSFYLLRASN